MSVKFTYASLGRALCVVALTVWWALLLAGPVAADQWVWPLRPRPAVVNDFDAPDPDWLPGHRGVDLAGSSDQRVHSAGSGEVTYAGMLAGIGVVVVRHGELRTTYQPVSASVEVGEQVAAGAVIGRLTKRGSHCAPAVCLHWGLLRGETYLDPLALLGMGPVRLLPQGDEAMQEPVALSPARSVQLPQADPSPDDGREPWTLAVGAAAVAGGALLAAQVRSRDANRSPPG